jgi:hypothetical protein
MANTIQCRGENRPFPEEEFELVPGWGLCHTKNVAFAHTVGGSALSPSEPVPLPDVAPPPESVDVPPAAPDGGGS